MCFNLLVRAAWILALLLGSAARTQPQSTAVTPVDTYPYLLRVSRVVPHLDTCVLLRRDGGYHLERDHDDSTDVYEGEISADELSRLQGWLENEQLRKLTRDQIMMPLVITKVESLQINIFRADHWQDLLFPSSESQIPFRESLSPLLGWFNDLHHAPHRTIPEDSGKNNCLTPRRIELKTRPTAAPQLEQPGLSAAGGGTGPGTDANVPTISPQTGQPAPSAIGGFSVSPVDVISRRMAISVSFLVRLEYDRFVQREVDRTCAIVYAGGRYHLEKSSQEIGGQVRSQTYESSLEPTTLEGLQQVLDDPDLLALEQGNVPNGVRFSFTDVTTVWIPRAKKVQHLVFASDLRVQAAIGSHYVVNDKNAKLVRPLQKWVLKLPADKTTLIRGGAPNACEPK